MKIAVVSLYTREIADYATLTSANKKQYCDFHGYDYIEYTHNLWPERPASFAKLIALERHIEDYDWLLWADADVAVLNPAPRLEQFLDPRYSAIFGCDHTGLNAGCWFLRRSVWSLMFLDLVKSYEPWNPEMCWEQDSIKNLMHKDHRLRPFVLLAGDCFVEHWGRRHPRFMVHAYGKKNPWRLKYFKYILQRHAHRFHHFLPSRVA